MKEALTTSKTNDEEKQSLEFFATMTAFNFHPGSHESIRFLRALVRKASELNQLFLSRTVVNILRHKF
jgi:hypothetical protein